MAVSQQKVFFGIHSAAFINRADGLPYGYLKALGNATLDASREEVSIFGGSNPYPFDTQYGNCSSKLSLTIREFKPFIYTLAGYTVASTALSTTGAVSTLTNILSQAAPVMHAGTGIASVAVTSADKANLKAGRYVVKAVSATEVSIYAYTDADGGAGVALPLLDDVMCVSNTLSVAQATTAVVALGVTFTKGNSTLGMTVGSTAYFDITPVNTGGSFSVTMGSNPVPVQCALLLAGQKLANGDIDYTYFPSVKVSSVPMTYEQNKHSEGDIQLAVNYDATLGSTFTKSYFQR
ncbi:MAG: hypothetical protein NTV01_01810 [Bacteroidia bacterium]|nr:hypothetical protein [Bacteroidia bacterium]